VDGSGYGAYTSGGSVQLVENTFTNLDHLIAEEVAILGTDVDGNTEVYDTETVDVSGDITLKDGSDYNFVVKAQVGLPSTYILKPMRLDLRTQQGSAMGSIKKISEVIISFYKTINAKIGSETDELYEIEWPTTLFTGSKIVSHDGGYDMDDNIIISGSDPTPCTVRAIIPRVEQTGR
jgi:hypothetical protein